MKVISYLWLVAFFVIAVAISGYSSVQEKKDVLFQASTVNALLEGVYDGEMTYEQLKRYGDFGLGGGEFFKIFLIGLEGKFYQIKADGIAYYRR